MKFYPICVNLNGAKAVVVGAGRVAERKLRRLLESGARVTVIAPVTTAQIAAWSKRRKLHWRRRKFRTSDVSGGVRFVIAATNDARLNARIARLAMRQRVLVNSATGRATGDVILPAVACKGDVMITISTGGKSPARARQWRETVEKIL